MKTIALVASLLVSGVAFANDVDPNGFEKEHFAPSSLTRAEVIANMKKPQVVTIKIDDQGRAITMPSTKSRTEVAAEARKVSHVYGEVADIGPAE